VLKAWPEAADFNRGVLEAGLSGRSLTFRNQQMRLYRNNYPESVWFDLYYSPIMDEAGKPQGVLAVVVETTQNVLAEKQRQVTEEARRISEELFRVAFANAATGMILIDRNGRFIRSNAAYSAITGYDERDLRNLNIFEITHPDDRARKTELVEQVLSGEVQGGVLEKRYIRPDGSIVWVQNSVSKAPTSQSGDDTIVIIAQDITERKRAEHALLHSNEEMQAFVYAASHDLREPLRTLASFTQLLARRYQRALDQDADEYIVHIVTAAKRMDALITDLLTYAKAGRLEGLPMYPVDLKRLAARVVGDLRMAIEESGAEIEIGDLPTVRGNMQQLDQLLQNLIGNAIKYHRSGTSPRIRLRAEHGTGEWVIAVQDNGRGFPQERAEYIFQVFKRLHGRDIPGTGIGLALCRRIVDRHGGKIWAESTPDAGSTFYFSLPE